MTLPQLIEPAIAPPSADTGLDELSEVVYPAGSRLRFQTRVEGYFCYIVRGRLSDKCATTHQSGDLIFFPANWSHVVDFPEETRCLIVRICPNTLDRLPADLRRLREPIKVPGLEAPWLARRLRGEFLERSRNGLAPGEPMLVEAAILQLLAMTARFIRKWHTGGGPFWLRQIRAAIDAQYLLMNYHLPDLASKAGVHPVHLAREFRRHYGTTIGGYIRKLRVEHACELLSRTDLSLREIAAACRFVDQSHFSNQFKKQCGVTPAEYRDLVTI